MNRELRTLSKPSPSSGHGKAALTPGGIMAFILIENARGMSAKCDVLLIIEDYPLMNFCAPLFVVALLLMSGSAEATVRKSALTVELVSLGRFIQIYHDQEGEYPQSWDELEKKNPDLDKTFSMLKPTRRMFLILPPIDLPRRCSGGGLAIAMTRDTYRPVGWEQWPIIGTSRRVLKEPVYGVIVMSNGGVSRREVPPEVMSSILKAEGMELPESSGLGAFAYEKELQARRYFNWIVVAGFCFWLIMRVMRRFKNPS